MKNSTLPPQSTNQEDQFPPDKTVSWSKKTTTYIKKNWLIVVLTFALIALIGLALFVFFQNSQKQISLETSSSRETQKIFKQLFEKPEPVQEKPPQPSPSPIWILPGKETYTISQGYKEGPRINKITIDPQDPTTNNSNQTITAELKYDQPIEKVELKLTSDNEEKLATMNLTEGTDKNGTWTANWQITDSVLFNYIVTLTVTSQGLESVVDLTIR